MDCKENENYRPNESSFNPRRFIFSELKIRKVKNFFPFGAGPRMYIGNHFATAEMAFIIHEFLSRFDIYPTDEIPVLWPLITLRPRNLFLQLKRI
jgi:hypothetical protein